MINMPDKEARLWSLGKGPQEMTSDERIAEAERQAEMNLEERGRAEKDEIARLRRDRENADSRESWQNIPKEEKRIGGERTKSFRNFAMPHATVFGSSGKTNAFRTDEKRRRLEKYLGRHTTVSTKERSAYLGALECFKDRRDGTLSVSGMRKMNRLIRTGETGGDKDMARAVEQMKEKGMIKDIKDVRKLVGRDAVRKIKQAMTKRSEPIIIARGGQDGSARHLPGGGSEASARRP